MECRESRAAVAVEKPCEAALVSAELGGEIAVLCQNILQGVPELNDNFRMSTSS